jgi:hypothetical protein
LQAQAGGPEFLERHAIRYDVRLGRV